MKEVSQYINETLGANAIVDPISKNDLPNPAIFEGNGFGKQDIQEIFNRFVKLFQLTE